RLAASLLGLTRREIDQKMDSIVAFADIGEHIDQPVRTYSSGMFVRLAFAVHAALEPEVLIVDEALAVGDAAFQAKCYRRLRELKERGTAILLVTHDIQTVR
ncbi:MAG: ABC transporter ATP-binding protein, partial [Betaproteobacteria bacterium]